MNKEKPAKRKTIRRIILIVLAAILLLSVVIVGMCLLNERPAVQTVATYKSEYGGTVINITDDGFCFDGWYENGTKVSEEKTRIDEYGANRIRQALFEREKNV